VAVHAGPASTPLAEPLVLPDPLPLAVPVLEPLPLAVPLPEPVPPLLPLPLPLLLPVPTPEATPLPEPPLLPVPLLEPLPLPAPPWLPVPLAKPLPPPVPLLLALPLPPVSKPVVEVVDPHELTTSATTLAAPKRSIDLGPGTHMESLRGGHTLRQTSRAPRSHLRLSRDVAGSGDGSANCGVTNRRSTRPQSRPNEKFGGSLREPPRRQGRQDTRQAEKR
jgi:hypothetical protein